jgi:NAD(P)-dependent dehydrogenase (short-subunit alcohol dehydrogenase family)
MDRIAIVTGGGSGIGRASALALAEAGWRVVIAGRRQDKLDQVCAEGGERLSAIQTDVTDEVSVSALFAEVIERCGRIDLLFNNAGLMPRAARIDEVALAGWSEVIAANVTGSFLCARAAFRQMVAQSPQGGRIINNGSISAHVPRLHSTVYTVSKHAVTGLTRSLSLEGRPFNIACGQIDIGNALTELMQGMEMKTLQANGTLAGEPTMSVAHAASSVVHMASLPLDANVQFMTVMATNMPYIGRG